MITIMQGERFELQSAGNGAVYLLRDKSETAETFLQGDDALDFEADLDTLESLHPDWATDIVLGWLWDQCGYEMGAR